MTRELDGCAALVTGAARNIGLAIATALASAGASVVIHARSSRADAAAAAASLRDRGLQAEARFADLTTPEEVRRLVDEAVAAYGRLDILVHAAAERADQRLAEIGWADWRRITGSILDAGFLLSQVALPHLRSAAPAGRASIVMIGGVAAHAGVPGRAHVAAAKAGISGLVRALAAELAEDGITVNCVSPGHIDTKRGAAGLPEHFRARPVPLGRPGRPEEVAAMVRHLCGPDGRFITGQTIHLNGGWYMG